MKRVITAAGLALAMAWTAACAGDHTSSPTTVTVTAAPPAQTSVAPTVTPTPVAQPPAEMGQWVTDGPLSFKVTFAGDGVYLAGDDPQFARDMGVAPPPPGTEFVNVLMTVSNTSSVPQMYRAADQMLRDDQGRLFAPSAATTTATANDRSRIDLNPGVSIEWVPLDFAVPPRTDVSQYTLVVHGSPHSAGSASRLHQRVAGDK